MSENERYLQKKQKTAFHTQSPPSGATALRRVHRDMADKAVRCSLSVGIAAAHCFKPLWLKQEARPDRCGSSPSHPLPRGHQIQETLHLCRLSGYQMLTVPSDVHCQVVSHQFTPRFMEACKPVVGFKWLRLPQ